MNPRVTLFDGQRDLEPGEIAGHRHEPRPRT